jgi:hypothetical protein
MASEHMHAFGRGDVHLEDSVGAGAFLRCMLLNVMLNAVRHATDEDLDRLEPLLAGLRGLSRLRERKRGSFSHGSRAFLHFHEDAGDLYVDVRLADTFERKRVTSAAEQADFLSRVREALEPAGSGPSASAL